MKEQKQKKRVSKKTILSSLIIVVFALCIALYGSLYLFVGKYGWADTAALIAPYPAIIVSPFSVISLGEIQKDIGSIRHFYENQDFSSIGARVDFSTPDGEKRLKVREKDLINTLIEGRVIRQLLDENNKRVTDEEVSESVARKIAEYGSGESVQENLFDLYGWTMRDFEKRVVRPSLEREKATAIFENRADKRRDIQARGAIEEASSALSGGLSFEDTAKKYSEGSTADEGGSLGWVSLGQVEPELAAVIPSLSKDGTSDIVESSLGYHILRVDDIREEKEETIYRLSQVFTRKETFADWLEEYIREKRVFVFLRAYQWNGETGFVEFSDPAMREFEAASSKS